MTRVEDYPFPQGLRLLHRWQAGDAGAKATLTEFFDAAIAGAFDDNFRQLAPADEIHATSDGYAKVAARFKSRINEAFASLGTS